MRLRTDSRIGTLRLNVELVFTNSAELTGMVHNNARIHLSRISCIAVSSPSHAVDAGRCMMDGLGRANEAGSPKSLHKSGSTEKAAPEHQAAVMSYRSVLPM